MKHLFQGFRFFKSIWGIQKKLGAGRVVVGSFIERLTWASDFRFKFKMNAADT